MAHRQNRHRRGVLYLKQGDIAVVAKRDQQFAQKRALAGLAVDEGRTAQTVDGSADRVQRPLGQSRSGFCFCTLAQVCSSLWPSSACTSSAA